MQNVGEFRRLSEIITEIIIKIEKTKTINDKYMKNDKDNDKYMKNDKYRQRQECGRLSENVGECQYSLWLLHYWLLCLGELLNAVHDCSAILRQDWLQLLSYSKSTHSSYLSIKWYGGRGRLNINQGLVAAMSVPSVYINPHATITDAPGPTRKKRRLKGWRAAVI